MDLDASVKEKIVVHAGGTIRIIAYISGKPAPEITWTRDDGPVPEEAVVEKTGISNSLIIKKCMRKHQGIYTLCAKNEGGERRKAIIVEVLGKETLNHMTLKLTIDIPLGRLAAPLGRVFHATYSEACSLPDI